MVTVITLNTTKIDLMKIVKTNFNGLKVFQGKSSLIKGAI